MRKSFSPQQRLDCSAIEDVQLNCDCRDEIIPILVALRYIYSSPDLRDAILQLIARDVNRESRRDIGRKGLDDWQILVLAAVRLGCNVDYDKLQDLAEQHRALRHIMGIGDWDTNTSFGWRRIRNTVCRLSPETIAKISEQIVLAGHEIDPEAVKKVRADSFVADTNIHHPTDSGLILDGMQKIFALCFVISGELDLPGWRQHEHLLRKIKAVTIAISRISGHKEPNRKKELQREYRKLFRRVGRVLQRAKSLVEQAKEYEVDLSTLGAIAELSRFIELTEQVGDTAYRRVILEEKVPNSEKIFSLFETHTQLYRRGKASEPNQFGRLVLLYEDNAGFILHHYVMPRDAKDDDVAVEQTRIVQSRYGGRVEELSFDRGFYSDMNESQLEKIVAHLCLPKKHAAAFAEQKKTESVKFHNSRTRHPGVESAIGALQFGNGLERCRDRTEQGFCRYIALGILGRNMHVLGKLLLQNEVPNSKSAATQRKRAA